MHVDVVELMVAGLAAVAIVRGVLLLLMVNDWLVMGLVTTKVMVLLRLLVMLFVMVFVVLLGCVVLQDQTMAVVLFGFGVDQLQGMRQHFIKCM